MKQLLKSVSVLTIVVLLSACGISTPLPTVMATTTGLTSTLFNPSITPSPLPVITSTLDVCTISREQNTIRILSDDRFTALQPGNPRFFDHILVEHNPAWATFQQEAQSEMRSAGITFHETAFGPELGTGVNPAVLLVTYGVEQNWELPPNGDLISRVDGIRAALHQHELDWMVGKVKQNQYPSIANAATYALYRYFNGDLSDLEHWCRTYVEVYNESPAVSSMVP